MFPLLQLYFLNSWKKKQHFNIQDTHWQGAIIVQAQAVQRGPPLIMFNLNRRSLWLHKVHHFLNKRLVLSEKIARHPQSFDFPSKFVFLWNSLRCVALICDIWSSVCSSTLRTLPNIADEKHGRGICNLTPVGLLKTQRHWKLEA